MSMTLRNLSKARLLNAKAVNVSSILEYRQTIISLFKAANYRIFM
jgi:hypothetical protein